MMFQRGSIQTGGLPFPKLKARALINHTAQAAGEAPDFSTRIRTAAGLQ